VSSPRPHLWPPMDLGIDSNRGGGELVLTQRWHLHYVAPQVGDSYTFESPGRTAPPRRCRPR